MNMRKKSTRRLMFVSTIIVTFLIAQNVIFFKSSYRLADTELHQPAYFYKRPHVYPMKTRWERPPTKNYACEVFDLGCFLMKSVPASKVRQISNLDECYIACGSGFAAITKGTDCICNPMKFVVKLNISSKFCNIPCPYQHDKKCGGLGVANLYRVVSSCQKVPFSEDFVETRRIGCSHGPSADSEFVTVEASSSNECLLACDSFEEPIAAFNGFTCRCGKMSDRFNLTHVAQSCHNNSTLTYRTMVEDRRCSIGLLPTRSMIRTTLASFPGSGNTWTRYLLEKATGFYTGSIYTDLSLENSGFLCESLDQRKSINCPIIKDHLFNKKSLFDQTIEVIRNPYDAILANINRFVTKDHTASANTTKLFGVLEEHLKAGHVRWSSHIKKVLEESKPLLIVYYEDLVNDPLKEVERMVRFLPIELQPKDLQQRLSCLSQELTGFNKRKKKVPLKFDPVSITTKQAIDLTIDDVRKAIAQIGFAKPLPRYNAIKR